MTAPYAVIFCLAFLVGAYATILPSWYGYGLGFGLFIILGLILPVVQNSLGWKKEPKRWAWLIAAIIAPLASLYVQMRTPQIAENDIAKYAPASAVVVRGKVLDNPTMTRSERIKLTLGVTQIDPDAQSVGETKSASNVDNATNAAGNPQKGLPKFVDVGGKLYVTLPLIQGTGIRAGQTVEVAGRLYLPKPVENVGGFDFRLYLARQGIFAGLGARTLTPLDDPGNFGDWWFTSRIVRTHVLGAGLPEGVLLSSLVLGNRAVDLPNNLRDTFLQAGLAAALAASGFQVALMLGAAMFLTRQLSLSRQFIVGLLAILAYVLLTGTSPSVLRAGVMGIGGLIGLVMQRRSRPVVGLLVAAIILLLVQPLWIWDLGFQFSFLATFGLVTTVEPITKRLPWLPPNIAALLAVPIAAYIWTLPVQLLIFGKLTPYSILANVLTTPLVTICTYGGVISGALGLLVTELGAVVSWLLYPLLHLMIKIAEWMNTLPKAGYNPGTISIWQMILAYGLLVLMWRVVWFSRRWIIPAVVLALVLFVPNAISQANTLQATIFATGETPVMVLRNGTQTTLINSGDRPFVTFTLFPWLQKMGINQIDLGIVTNTQPDFSDGWNALLTGGMTIKQMRDVPGNISPKTYTELQTSLRAQNLGTTPLTIGEEIPISPQVSLKLVYISPNIFTLKIGDLSWLLLADTDLKSQQTLVDTKPAPENPDKPPDADNPKVTLPKEVLSQLNAQVLWWSGGQILPEVLQAVKPKIAIGSSMSIAEETALQLAEAKVRVYWTGKDGSIQWTPNGDIQTLRDQQDQLSLI